MDNKNKNNYLSDETSLNRYNDQYYQIKDTLDIVESTDSETTNLENFRVVNKNNSYPLENSKE